MTIKNSLLGCALCLLILGMAASVTVLPSNASSSQIPDIEKADCACSHEIQTSIEANMAENLASLSVTGSGIGCFDRTFSGMVYILPSGASTLKWTQLYGDRIYFYARSNLEEYANHLEKDFRIIAAKYQFVIIVVPAEDSPQYYRNLGLIDAIAMRNNLRVMFAIFPKEKYGPEWSYLTPGTAMHKLVLSNMKFMSGLARTWAIGVWYGWKERKRSTPLKEIDAFQKSLPEDVRRIYWVWVDDVYVAQVLPIRDLGVPVVTELYNRRYISKYGGAFQRQMIVTGFWGAQTAADWVSGIRGLLSHVSCAQVEPRLLGVWIFYDANDGSNEQLGAYVGGDLANPLV